MSISDIVGVIPAIVFPTATLYQLIHLYRAKSSEGVSALAWAAFFIGNLSVYFYTEKYFQLQAIVAFLVTGVFQLMIVMLAMKYRAKAK